MRTFFIKKPVAAGLIIIAVFLLFSSLAIRSLIRHEKQMAYSSWQAALEKKSDQTTHSLSQWLEQQCQVLGSLTDNSSLMLYSQQIMAAAHPNQAAAQTSYLRNLLFATAERNGFMPQESSEKEIKADFVTPANSGLAVIDLEQRIIVATSGLSLPRDVLDLFIPKALAADRPTITALYKNLNGQPTLGFLSPFHGLQPDKNDTKIIGLVFGYKGVSQSLYPLLETREKPSSSEEAILVTASDNSVTYLSPLADGTAPLSANIAVNSALAAAFAVNNPGTFGERADYTGSKVIFSSRRVPRTDWTLIQKINSEEAFHESSAHQRFLLTSLTFATLIIAAALFATWWYACSCRDQAVAAELTRKSTELETKQLLLDTINNNIFDLIVMVTDSYHCIFTNAHLAKLLGARPDDFRDKPLPLLLGSSNTEKLTPFIVTTLAKAASQTTSMVLDLHGAPHFLHVTCTPIAYNSDSYDTVLVSMHDVTDLHLAREKEAKLLQKLIKALMDAIDRHDPYSANHSSKTACLAVGIGKAMGLCAADLKTVEIAANLCNLGKLSIAKEILTKTERLTDDECREIRLETRYAFDLLKDLAFDGPVIETIMQKNELLDGSGHPAQISGEQIIPTARILAAANAFVAMISPRAYRNKLSTQEAMTSLLQEADLKYDRKVLAALFHVVENEIDWSTWYGKASALSEKE